MEIEIVFTREFLADLIKTNLGKDFAYTALNKILDGKGQFVRDADDHEFHGLKNGWIRYITKGTRGYRAVYIQDGNKVFLYRAGKHSVEDEIERLSKKPTTADLRAVANSGEAPIEPGAGHYGDFGEIVTESEPVAISDVLRAMYHVPHEVIYLVSPAISEELLVTNSPFRRFLDRSVDDGTAVAVITNPVNVRDIKIFETLDRQNIMVFFNKKLNGRAVYFRVVSGAKNADISDLAIVGSAELTPANVFGDGESLSELCYKLPQSYIPLFGQVIESIVDDSTDYLTYMKLSGAK